MERKLFVLGATGFIGRELVREALRAGWMVKALARSDEGLTWLRAVGAHPVRGDVLEPSAWAAEAGEAEVMIDLIQPKLPGRLSVKAIQRVSRYQQRVMRAILTGIKNLSPDKRPLLVAVSGTDDLQPDHHGNIGAASRLRDHPLGFARIGVPLRQLIEASGVSAAHVYLGTVYGPGKGFAAKVFPRLRKGRLPVIGSGRNRLPMIHVSDVARGLVHLSALPAGEFAGRTVVLADGSGTTQREFLEHAARLLSAPPPRSIPKWLAGLVAGKVMVELMARDVYADPSDLFRTGFRLRYKSCRDGLPPSLTALGYLAQQHRAAAPGTAEKRGVGCPSHLDMRSGSRSSKPSD